MRTALIVALLMLLAAISRAAPTTYTLSISTSGPDTPTTVITSTPSGIICPGSCSAVFLASATVTIGEVSVSSLAFVGWSAPCRTNHQSCNVKMVADTAITAKFNPILDLSFFGSGIGSVAISTQPVFYSTAAGGANHAVRSFVYPVATQIVLHESTGTASAFTGWTGDSGCSTASTCTVTLSTYKHIVATFTATGTVGVSSFTIKVVVPKGGGIIRSSPAGILCGTSTTTVCSAAFYSGATVSLSTEALAGYRFAGWSNGGCSGTTPCVIKSTSPLQGTGSRFSPAAYFFKNQ